MVDFRAIASAALMMLSDAFSNAAVKFEEWSIAADPYEPSEFSVPSHYVSGIDLKIPDGQWYITGDAIPWCLDDEEDVLVYGRVFLGDVEDVLELDEVEV